MNLRWAYLAFGSSATRLDIYESVQLWAGIGLDPSWMSGLYSARLRPRWVGLLLVWPEVVVEVRFFQSWHQDIVGRKDTGCTSGEWLGEMRQRFPAPYMQDMVLLDIV